ncbi:flagellar basal body L-ring protein FlgH [Brevundimonas faecalis]|uniref:flagellar basal body L-ring protein FlgH n=1 Tax=Brevundimonas faecalis TaxID=947378 RepID=UPI00360FAE74
MIRRAALCFLPLAAFIAASPAPAQVMDPGFAGLAGDRSAARVGDALTVLIMEASSASQSARSGSQKDTRLGGTASGGDFDESGALRLEGRYDGRGEASRSGRLMGQITVTVHEVLNNGDMVVAGEQTIAIDGERNRIRLQGRVRRADVSANNTVLSSRLADVEIAYAGHGALSRSASPGFLNRALAWLGLS